MEIKPCVRVHVQRCHLRLPLFAHQHSITDRVLSWSSLIMHGCVAWLLSLPPTLSVQAASLTDQYSDQIMLAWLCGMIAITATNPVSAGSKSHRSILWSDHACMAVWHDCYHCHQPCQCRQQVSQINTLIRSCLHGCVAWLLSLPPTLSVQAASLTDQYSDQIMLAWLCGMIAITATNPVSAGSKSHRSILWSDHACMAVWHDCYHCHQPCQCRQQVSQINTLIRSCLHLH